MSKGEGYSDLGSTISDFRGHFRFGIVTGLPLHLGGVACAIGSRQWKNNSTNLLWMKYVGKLYCQFCNCYTYGGKQVSQQGEPMKAVQNEVSPKRYTNVIHQTG